jgi:hypothetical protein
MSGLMSLGWPVMLVACKFDDCALESHEESCTLPLI